MIHGLRESWKKLASVDDMQKPVEIDETFFDGSYSNRRKEKKNTKPKIVVVDVKNRSTNKIATEPVSETTAIRLTHFVDEYMDKNAKKYTDENRVYVVLSNHESVRHPVGKYVREWPIRTDSNPSGL